MANKIKTKKSLPALLLILLFVLGLPTGAVFAAEGPQLVSQEDGEGEEETNNEFVEVVVARVPIPLGTRLEMEHLETELRPTNNIAVRGGYFFGAPEEVAGSIVKTNIAQGQEVLAPMLAINAADLPAMGSDLSLHIDNGRVSVAFPVNTLSAASFAMRPGDFVDVMMSFDLIELDLEFQTPLPNITRLIDADALEAGESFLLPAVTQGRLELIPEINRVVEIVPQSIDSLTVSSGAETIVQQIPRRTSQLTIQQAEVLWLGDWVHGGQSGWQGPNNYALLVQLEELKRLERDVERLSAEDRERLLIDYGLQAQTLRDQLAIARNRLNQLTPDIILLSLPLQDALTLKWALEEPGIDIDLALRSQGDRATFVTTAVSLPQLVEQAGLAIPELSQFGLEPNIESFPTP